MQNRWFFTGGLMLIMLTGWRDMQEDIPLTYVIKKTKTLPQIDGKLDDHAWKKSAWSSYFVDITGDAGKKPLQKTRCKMLWDDQYLYIGAELFEKDLWATLKNHDDIIFHDNDFEVFIDPNNDGHQYFEIEINALGTVMDLFMHKTYKQGGPMDMKWDTKGMISAVQLNGTLNENRDTDSSWTLEMAIPFSCMERPGRISKPEAGQTWRINFSRVQWQLEKSGTGYIKKIKSDGTKIPEDNWVWSQQGIINMHVPEKWGFLVFKQ